MRQALTSAVVGAAAAILVAVVWHGSLSPRQYELAATIGVAVGVSRLIEFRR